MEAGLRRVLEETVENGGEGHALLLRGRMDAAGRQARLFVDGDFSKDGRTDR